MWDIFKLKKAGIFAGGVLFGTAGVKILASDDAKKVYTNCTAAVLRAKDCVMKTASLQRLSRSMSHVQQKRLRLSTKQKKQKRQKLRKRIQVRRISKRKKFKSQ